MTEASHQQGAVVIGGDGNMSLWQKLERSCVRSTLSVDEDISNFFIDVNVRTVGRTPYEKLSFIFKTQSWNAVADSFWLHSILDIMLYPIESSEPCSLIFGEDARDKNVSGLGLPGAPMGSSHEATTTGDLMRMLRGMARVDRRVTYDLWIAAYPLIWAGLAPGDQVALAKPLLAFLSKEFHLKGATSGVNGIQALLHGILLSSPRPKMPPELTRYLGLTYGGWDVAISLLETNLMLYEDDHHSAMYLSAFYD